MKEYKGLNIAAMNLDNEFGWNRTDIKIWYIIALPKCSLTDCQELIKLLIGKKPI